MNELDMCGKNCTVLYFCNDFIKPCSILIFLAHICIPYFTHVSLFYYVENRKPA